MDSTQANLAVLPIDSSGWTAGQLYTTNILSSLASLPDSERPKVQVFFDAKFKLDPHSELARIAPKPRSFAWRESNRPIHKLAGGALQAARLRRPRSLESLVVESGVTAVFSARASLGTRFPVPWVGWIPDFQHRHLPEFFSKEEVDRRDSIFELLINESDRIIVSSYCARDDLLRWYQTDPDKVAVLQFASAIRDQPSESENSNSVELPLLPKRYFMFPSQLWKHKNHMTLFKAMHILRQRGHHDVCLVCTGRMQDYRWPDYPQELQNWIKTHDMSRNIRMLGFLPRLSQLKIMQGAMAIVQPSLFEGWSMLVEDALALGKRLFISDIPVHREQDPPAASFFNPLDAEQLADQMQALWLAKPVDLPTIELGDQQRQRTYRFAHRFIDIMNFQRNS